MSVDPNAVKAVFLVALEKASAADRSAYLAEACAGNSSLRRRVEALLTAHDRPDSLLDQSADRHLAAGDEEQLVDALEPSANPATLGRLGHYEVRGVVGRGGMGVVLRAFDEKLHRVVAIKMLAPGLAASGTARQRFVREARAAAAVAHDNVIGIHAVEDAGPVPYLVMQFVDGRTLQDKLNHTGPLPLTEVVRIGLQLAEGLAAAHRQGLIHRDIKPANILLENGVERVRITDFGLARATDDASLTGAGVVAGTPEYMSPEQANGERVDHRSDLFSLGSVLYAMCAGHPPFRAETSLAVLKRVCEETPRPLREVNPAVPEWLEALVAELQAKDPAKRPADTAAVAARLGRGLRQLQAGAPAGVTGLTGRFESGRAPRAGRFRAARPLLWAGLIVLASLAGGWFIRDRWAGNPGPGPVTPGHPADDTGGQPQAKEWKPSPLPTADELAKRPSPLDGRTPADVPPDLRALAGGGTPERAPAELIAVLGAGEPILDVAVSPDGRTVAGGGRPPVRLWDLGGWRRGAAEPPCRLLTGHTNNVWSVAFSPDGRLLASGSFDGTVGLWDVATGHKVRDLAGHSRRHSLIAFSPDARVLAAGDDDGSVNRWDVATGQRLEPLRLHVGVVRAVAFSRDGRFLASAGDDGTVQVTETATGRRRHLFRGDTKRTNVGFSPDGAVVAAACDGPGPSARIWAVETGEEAPALVGHTSHVGGLAFHPLGRLVATGSWDGLARLWDRATGGTKALVLGPDEEGERVSVAWSPEGRYLVASRYQRGVYLLRAPASLPP